LLRRIATGALVLGSAAALLIGGATYAPFSDDAQGSGGVGAGIVAVDINGTDEAAFDFSTAQCSNMAPGHPCQVPLVVSAGASTLSATWATTITDTDDPDIDCFTASASVPNGEDEAGDANDDIDPGFVHNGTLTVTVADNNACQGAVSTITVAVVSTQSPTPHD
jgi:hypothetical protein